MSVRRLLLMVGVLAVVSVGSLVVYFVRRESGGLDGAYLSESASAPGRAAGFYFEPSNHADVFLGVSVGLAAAACFVGLVGLLWLRSDRASPGLMTSA